MPLLRPLRDYNEKDVINLFAFSGVSFTQGVILNKGTLVAPVGNGWRNDSSSPLQINGTYGAFSTNNVQALRYGPSALVTFYGTGQQASGFPGETPLGITLFDVREYDENNIPLIYAPRKAAELEAVLSGYTVPIVTKGVFLYSGLTGTFNAGTTLYGGPSGTITTATGGTKVGLALGNTGVDGSALIRLSI